MLCCNEIKCSSTSEYLQIYKRGAYKYILLKGDPTYFIPSLKKN